MTKSANETVYLGFFWNDARQEATDWLVSDNRDDVIAAARGYLVDLDIPDANFETFLLQRLADWDADLPAERPFVSTLGHGKLVLLSAQVERRDAQPRFRKCAT